MPSRNLVYGLAALALAFILGGVVALQRFAKLEAETQGPSVIAVGADGAVLLGARHELFLVQRDRSAERIALTDLGLGGPVVAVGWDGKDWFVGDDASGTVHRCDLVARRCSPALAPSQERWLRRTAKLAFAPDRIYVTDTERHRLLAFDGSGKPLAATRTAPIALCFPNGIRAHDGGLLIADTNNHRIAWVDPAAEFASETYLNAVASPPVARAQCSDASKHLGERGDAMVNTLVDANTGGRDTTRAHKAARAGRKWPSAVEVVRAPEGEEIWVIVADSGMRDGDLLAFGLDEDLPRRMPLPADTDPVELAQLGDFVLVTDPTNMKVHAVFAAYGDAPPVADWSPPGLEAAFATQREQRAAYRVLRFGATGGIGLGVLLALIVVVLEKKREAAEAVSGPAIAVARLDGAVPERLRVDRADGRLVIEYQWFGARERRMSTLALAAVGVVVVLFLLVQLNPLREGGEFKLSMLHPLVFFLFIVVSGVTFAARTVWRLDAGVLTWTTTPMPVFSNGSIARGEVRGIRLISPPTGILQPGRAGVRGFALELVPRTGKPRRLMQGTERELALWVGGTLAKALGLEGVIGA